MLNKLARFSHVYVTYLDTDGYPALQQTTFEVVNSTLLLPHFSPSSDLLTLTFIATTSGVPYEGSKYITLTGYLQPDHTVKIESMQEHTYNNYADHIQQLIPNAREYIQSFNQQLALQTLSGNTSATLLIAAELPISRKIMYNLVNDHTIQTEISSSDPIIAHLGLQNRVKLLFHNNITMQGTARVVTVNSATSTLAISIFRLAYGSNQEIEVYEFKQYKPTTWQELQQTVKSKLKFWYYGFRLPFVVITLLAFLLGSTIAYFYNGSLRYDLLTVGFIALGFLQMAANAFNDFFDSQSDKYNYLLTSSHRSFYHGGSRFIQNEVVTPVTFLLSGSITAVIGSLFGLWLLALLSVSARLSVLFLGTLGISFAVFYSAPPLKIAYHGFGELSIAITWAYLPALGAYFLQVQNLNLSILLLALPIALHVFAFSVANSVPDIVADSRANKQTLPVVFGIVGAYKIIIAVILLEYLFMILFVMLHIIPIGGLVMLLLLVFDIPVFRILKSYPLEMPISVNKSLFYTYILLNLVFGGYLCIA